MFRVELYKYSKKRNSTARPINNSDYDTKKTYACLLRKGSSLSTPVIEIENIEPTNDLFECNYAYIPDFHRYYFIDDVQYNNPIWVFNLTVDVLATYKDDILNSRQYVLRSSSTFDIDLPDNFYPTLPKSTDVYAEEPYTSNAIWRYDSSNEQWWNAVFFNVTPNTGCVVVGILGNTTTGVTYFAFNVRSFNNFLSYAFNLIPSDMTSVDNGIAKALYNPLQYITSARWFPTLPLINNTGGSRTTINLGGEIITLDPLDICYVLSTGTVEKFKFSMSLPSHPDATNYGYRNLSPYTQYNLYLQPFGDFPLDTYKLFDSPGITIYWDMDYATGATALKIYSQLGNKLVFSDNATLGVPIPISSLIYDAKTGLALSGLQFLRTITNDGNVPSFFDFTPNNTPIGASSVQKWAQDIRKAIGIEDYELKPLLPSFDNTDNARSLGSVMDVIGTSLGQVVTKGDSNSFLAYNMGRPFIYAWFMKQTEVDVGRFGRPLRQNVRLDNLSGFTICGNATVSFAGPQFPTDREHSRVLAYLNRGFYIE